MSHCHHLHNESLCTPDTWAQILLVLLLSLYLPELWAPGVEVIRKFAKHRMIVHDCITRHEAHGGMVMFSCILPGSCRVLIKMVNISNTAVFSAALTLGPEESWSSSSVTTQFMGVLPRHALGSGTPKSNSLKLDALSFNSNASSKVLGLTSKLWHPKLKLWRMCTTSQAQLQRQGSRKASCSKRNHDFSTFYSI